MANGSASLVLENMFLIIARNTTISGTQTHKSRHVPRVSVNRIGKMFIKGNVTIKETIQKTPSYA